MNIYLKILDEILECIVFKAIGKDIPWRHSISQPIPPVDVVVETLPLDHAAKAKILRFKCKNKNLLIKSFI
jgi:hypothetical protein